jgi:hypothetical protein
VVLTERSFFRQAIITVVYNYTNILRLGLEEMGLPACAVPVMTDCFVTATRLLAMTSGLARQDMTEGLYEFPALRDNPP